MISAVLVGVAVQAVRNINRSGASSDWVNHTHAVILELDALRASLSAAEGGMHIYLLTANARDLAATRDALADLTSHMEIVHALTREEPGQPGSTAQLESLGTQFAVAVQTVLGARQSGDLAAARALLYEDRVGAVVREMRRTLEKLKNAELALLTERDTASYRQAERTRWTVWLGVVVDVILLGGVVWLIRDDVSARRRAASVLERANAELKTRVAERTGELEQANRQLVAENLERQWSIQALEHQSRYDQLIIDSIPSLVLVVTKVMNISRINPAVTEATGLRAPDLINRPLHSLLELHPDPATAAPMSDRMAYAVKMGRELRADGLLRHATLGKRHVRVMLCPLRDGNKIVGGVIILEALPAPGSPV
ncbi:MAG TPA: CHASE3 domain-containing protein [Opitutaceae bacterium]|nr:CHASE3 domain-containing protein [Opitutaceae bacterium]